MTRSGLHFIASSSVPAGTRGALNQWYLEVLPGIFVGRVSARIREQLWELLAETLLDDPGGYAVSVHQSQAEQGFTLRQVGEHQYQLEEFMGLQLVARHTKEAPAGVLEPLPDPSW